MNPSASSSSASIGTQNREVLQSAIEIVQLHGFSLQPSPLFAAHSGTSSRLRQPQAPKPAHSPSSRPGTLNAASFGKIAPSFSIPPNPNSGPSSNNPAPIATDLQGKSSLNVFEDREQLFHHARKFFQKNSKPHEADPSNIEAAAEQVIATLSQPQLYGFLLQLTKNYQLTHHKNNYQPQHDYDDIQLMDQNNN